MSNPSKSESAGHVTVLVVEDEILVRMAISEYLRHCGFRVVETASVDEALTILTETDISVDIVFSDIEMPGSMNGFALAAWVHENRPDLKIILTGNVKQAADAAGDLCGNGPHLKKPYEPQQVVEWIKRLRAAADTKVCDVKSVSPPP